MSHLSPFMKESINNWSKIFGWLFLFFLVGLLVFDFVRRGIFDNKTGINLLVVGDENAGLLVIRPEESVVNWVELPTNLKVKIYDSSATYPITSLWSFGQAEKKPFQVVEKSIGSSLGVVIPRTIKVDRVASVENILGKFLSIGLKTDLSFRDRWLIRGIVSDAAVSKKIFEQEIPKTAYDKVVEADGKEFLMFNKIVDVWARDKFYHDDILQEGSEVSINNLSDVSGAGLSLSGQLDSAGFRVVDVKNDPKDSIHPKGCYFLASKKVALSSKYLEEQVGCRPLPKTEQKETAENLIKIWLE